MERTQEHIRHDGAGMLSLTGCHFTAWDRAGKNDPAVRASRGRLIVNGCEFMDAGKRAIRMEKGLTSAAILGCALRAGDAVENLSGADVQMGLNTTH